MQLAVADASAATVAKRNGGIAPKGAGVTTANQCRTNFHTALQDAVRGLQLARNPVAATRPLKTFSADLVIWTPEQMTHFMNVTRDHSLYTLFLLAVGSGLRRGELLGLRWQDIGTNHITVRQTVKLASGKVIFGPPKTKNSARRVAVTNDVLTALMACKSSESDSGLVFPTRSGGPIHPRNLARTWDTLQNKARLSLPDLPHTGLHALRHFHASLAIRGGMNPKMLADRLGHANVTITLNRYTHLWEEQREASAVGISGLLVAQSPAYFN